MTDWQDIVSRHGPTVWRTAYRLLGNRTDAEDCFQETFLAALHLQQRQPVRHWPATLQRLATARAIDRLRQRGRQAGREQSAGWDTVSSPAPSPEQHAEATELSERLRHALAHLPPRAAEVFCLHALEGWAYADIAVHLSITVDAVGVALHRARQQLRELLAPADPCRRLED